jgi:hypothetical protein
MVYHQETVTMDKYTNKLPAIILTIGAAVRILGTGAAAIWFDESNMLYRTTIPFMTLFTEHSERSGDFLLEIILRPIMLLGNSVWLLRLPSMIAAVVSLWLVWKLINRFNFTIRQQIFATVAVSFIPGLIWLAQDARSYSLLSLLLLASLWFALDGNWLGLTATSGLMIYCHSTAPVFVAGILLLSWYLHPRQLRFVIIVGVCASIAWVPAVVRMLGYWIIQAPWQPVLTLNWFVYSSMESLFTVPWSGVFPLLVAVALLLTFVLVIITTINIIRSDPDAVQVQAVLLICWVTPIVGMTAACFILKQNILNYRTLMPVLYPFALWLGWRLGTWDKSRWVVSPWLPVILIGITYWSPATRGAGLDKVADEIRKQWRDGDQLIYTTVTTGLPFNYYLSDLPHTWSNIIQDPYFLGVPTIIRDELTQPGKHYTRYWIVIPDERLIITPEEADQLKQLVNDQYPVYALKYLQTATINVYLVEDK